MKVHDLHLLERNEKLNAQSSDHIIYQLIERMAINDHPDSNQSINHNQFTILTAVMCSYI